MKEFVKDNGKLLIISITLITITSIICVTTFSYAAGNGSTQIYTRDELSEKIEILQQKTSDSESFLRSYPVGSIYTSVSSTNPSSIYGGTWVSFGSGRTLVGVDTSQTEFNRVEITGGEKQHILSIAEMPTHSHTFEFFRNNTVSDPFGYLGRDGIYQDGDGSYNFGLSNSIDAYANWSIGISHKGGSQAHNNLQPYITVYMWKRTA